MWLTPALVFLLCSSSFATPQYKLPALTEEIQAVLTKNSSNGGGGGDRGMFMQVWRDANVTYDHDDDGIMTYFYHSILIEKIISESTVDDDIFQPN